MDADVLKWIETMPSEIFDGIRGAKVVLAGFGAGPAFVAQKIEWFDPPVSIEDGFRWLTRWQGTFRRARLVFDNGTTLFFDTRSWLSAESEENLT